MLLLVLLDGRKLIGTRRAETPPVVDVDDLGILEVNHQIRSVIASDIDKAQRHWHQVRVCTIELRPDEDTRFGGVTPWELDDLDVPMQVERDKMAWIARRVVMTDNGIGLKRSGASIVQIVPRGIPPADRHGHQCPQREHNYHPHTQVQ
jgi:hypothetical protein